MSSNPLERASQQHEEILRLLAQKRLKEAQRELESFVTDLNDYPLQTRLEEVKTSYSYLLSYVRRGVEDPTRSKMLQDILLRTGELNLQAYQCYKDKYDNNRYHAERRLQRGTPFEPQRWLAALEEYSDDLSLSQLATGSADQEVTIIKQHEQTLSQLFNATWASDLWSKTIAAEMQGYLTSERLYPADRQLLVSAVTLGTWEYFDVNKLSWLMTACTHEDPVTRLRALTGVFLTLCLHQGCLTDYPMLHAQFSLLCEQYEVIRLLTFLAMTMFRSFDVEEINQRMQQEILPKMMKDLQEKAQKQAQEEGDGDEAGFSPDWEKFTQGVTGEKMREMGELQMKGFDLNYGTFSRLKQFPFFQSLCHWFYPYDPHVLTSLGIDARKHQKQANVLNMVLQSGLVCDSDKYSLCFLMERLTGELSKSLLERTFSSNLMGEIEQREELLQEKALAPESILQLYIQDLYRFYHLSSLRQGLRNPFEHPQELGLCDQLIAWTKESALVKPLADYLLEQHHYEEAAHAYTLLQQPDNAELTAKLGYCYQHLRQYDKAIQCYLHADILQPDHLWTLSQLATCYRRIQRYEEAVKYYRQLEYLKPGKNSVLYHLGHSLRLLGRFEEALSPLFQLDIQDEHNPKVWRDILWCSLQLGKEETCRSYIEKLLAEPNPDATDFLHAGHFAWLMEDEEAAVGHYQECCSCCDTPDEFYNLMQVDYRSLLEAKGMTRSDLTLLIDAAIG